MLFELGKILEEEIWKPTNIFPDFYEVSNYGNVRSVDRYILHNTSKTGRRFVKGQQLKLGNNHKGYKLAYLSHDCDEKTVMVHRLVACAFIPNPNNYPQVNHIDGNKTNNYYKNLEWCDNSMNQIHAYKMGLHIHSGNSGRKKIPVAQYTLDKSKLIAIYPSISDASRKTGISCCGIKKAIFKQTHFCGVIRGYYFEIASLETESEVMPNE